MVDKKRVLGIYIEPKIIERIKKEAKKEKRSLSAQVAWILQGWIERENHGTRKEV